MVGTENYRNVSEERPQSQQADKLGTRVYRSCAKVGAVTLVRAITAQQWRESALVRREWFTAEKRRRGRRFLKAENAPDEERRGLHTYIQPRRAFH